MPTKYTKILTTEETTGQWTTTWNIRQRA